MQKVSHLLVLCEIDKNFTENWHYVALGEITGSDIDDRSEAEVRSLNERF
jgi:hypothetical protein